MTVQNRPFGLFSDCKKSRFSILFWSEVTSNFQNPRTCALDFALDPRKRARNRGYQSQFLQELALYLGGLGSPGKAVEVLRQPQAHPFGCAFIML